MTVQPNEISSLLIQGKTIEVTNRHGVSNVIEKRDYLLLLRTALDYGVSFEALCEKLQLKFRVLS